MTIETLSYQPGYKPGYQLLKRPLLPHGASLLSPSARAVSEPIPTSAEQSPILLFGMPRSGTTWVGKLFDSHPGTIYRHEPDSVKRLQGVPLTASAELADYYRHRIRDYVDSIVPMTAAKTSGQLPLFPKSHLAPGSYSAQCCWVILGKAAERLFGRWPMPSFATATAVSRSRLVWKSIESLARTGVVLDALPRARCVIILRHPCGQIASRLAGSSAAKFDSEVGPENDSGVMDAMLSTASAQRHGLTRERLAQMSVEEKLTWNWVVFNEKALDDVEQLGLNDRCRVLVYEQLCAEPERRLRELFAFTGLEWHAQTARFIDKSTGSHRQNYYSVYKKPLQAAYAWRGQLTADQIVTVEKILGQSRLARFYPE